MSRCIVNPDKFNKLPQHVQDAIVTLGPKQLSLLQASFSNFTHFDFLGLPPEIRGIIIDKTLATRTERVKLGARCKCCSHPDASLLTVSKQVSMETLMSMRRLKTCVLEWPEERHITPQQRSCLRLFRQFHIRIEFRSRMLGEASMNRLNDFLLNLANELIVSHTNATEQDAKLSVQIEFTNKNWLISRGLEDARALFSAASKPTSKLPKQEILFWRAQLQWQVDETRMVLKSRLSNVEIRVNTEREWAGCKVKRVDASEVEIKDILPQTRTRVRASACNRKLEWTVTEEDESL